MSSPNDLRFDDDMEVAVRAYRKGLVVHCSQFLGSFEDAEEAAQEALVRAWRSRDGFRGDSTTKTWLFSIATRVCLDLLRGRKRRIVPASLTVPSDPYSTSESVRLAFVAALQTPPARQRAVLILREVLAWSAGEVAVTLECSVSSVNSSLHRARLQMRDAYHASGVDSFPDVSIDDPVVAATLERFVRAWQTSDIDELVDTLSADVRLAMPPVPSWYSGRDDVLAFIERFVGPLGRTDLVPAYFNAQPGFTMSIADPEGQTNRVSQMVLTVDAGGISAIDVFDRDDVA